MTTCQQCGREKTRPTSKPRARRKCVPCHLRRLRAWQARQVSLPMHEASSQHEPDVNYEDINYQTKEQDR